MARRIIFLLFFLIFSLQTYSQVSLNDYKYIIVPKKYDFLSEENKYQLNVLTKFLFEKNNFSVVYDDSFPEDYAANNCLGLRSNVINKKSLLSTKLYVELRDCRDQVVFTSEIGISKIKNYKASYQDALRKAFKSFEQLNYKYVPKENTNENITVVQNKPVKKVEEASEKVQNATSETKKTIDKQVSAAKNEVTTTVAKENPNKNDEALLYAQPTANGFQLIDSTPKIVFVLFKTSLENVYLLKNKRGMLLNKNGVWIAEYYDDSGKRIQEEVKVKF